MPEFHQAIYGKWLSYRKGPIVHGEHSMTGWTPGIPTAVLSECQPERMYLDHGQWSECSWREQGGIIGLKRIVDTGDRDRPWMLFSRQNGISEAGTGGSGGGNFRFFTHAHFWAVPAEKWSAAMLPAMAALETEPLWIAPEHRGARAEDLKPAELPLVSIEVAATPLGLPSNWLAPGLEEMLRALLAGERLGIQAEPGADLLEFCESLQTLLAALPKPLRDALPIAAGLTKVRADSGWAIGYGRLIETDVSFGTGRAGDGYGKRSSVADGYIDWLKKGIGPLTQPTTAALAEAVNLKWGSQPPAVASLPTTHRLEVEGDIAWEQAVALRQATMPDLTAPSAASREPWQEVARRYAGVMEEECWLTMQLTPLLAGQREDCAMPQHLSHRAAEAAELLWEDLEGDASSGLSAQAADLRDKLRAASLGWSLDEEDFAQVYAQTVGHQFFLSLRAAQKDSAALVLSVQDIARLAQANFSGQVLELAAQAFSTALASPVDGQEEARLELWREALAKSGWVADLLRRNEPIVLCQMLAGWDMAKLPECLRRLAAETDLEIAWPWRPTALSGHPDHNRERAETLARIVEEAQRARPAEELFELVVDSAGQHGSEWAYWTLLEVFSEHQPVRSADRLDHLETLLQRLLNEKTPPPFVVGEVLAALRRVQQPEVNYPQQIAVLNRALGGPLAVGSPPWQPMELLMARVTQGYDSWAGGLVALAALSLHDHNALNCYAAALRAYLAGGPPTLLEMECCAPAVRWLEGLMEHRLPHQVGPLVGATSRVFIEDVAVDLGEVFYRLAKRMLRRASYPDDAAHLLAGPWELLIYCEGVWDAWESSACELPVLTVSQQRVAMEALLDRDSSLGKAWTEALRDAEAACKRLASGRLRGDDEEARLLNLPPPSLPGSFHQQATAGAMLGSTTRQAVIPSPKKDSLLYRPLPEGWRLLLFLAGIKPGLDAKQQRGDFSHARELSSQLQAGPFALWLKLLARQVDPPLEGVQRLLVSLLHVEYLEEPMTRTSGFTSRRRTQTRATIEVSFLGSTTRQPERTEVTLETAENLVATLKPYTQRAPQALASLTKVLEAWKTEIRIRFQIPRGGALPSEVANELSCLERLLAQLTHQRSGYAAE